MKPQILVLYHSQSGQMLDILNHLVRDMHNEADIRFAAITLQKPFPWPWNSYAFFDAMPESVERIPQPVLPLNEEIKGMNYDLIILGYQPWFLNPSQPITGFFNSEEASLLRDKPVVTVIGCRNMWLHGQEQIKQDLQKTGARLVGNIVLADHHHNLVSLITIIRWAFSGKKERTSLLPEAGVQTTDIKNAARFGKPILKALKEKNFDSLQKNLLDLKAVELKPGLILLEQTGIKNFRHWAKFIREKGGPGSLERKGRVLLFKRLLLTAIFILSPLKSISAAIKLQLKKKKLVKDLDYFKGVEYEGGRI